MDVFPTWKLKVLTLVLQASSSRNRTCNTQLRMLTHFTALEILTHNARRSALLKRRVCATGLSAPDLYLSLSVTSRSGSPERLHVFRHAPL